MGIGMVIVAFIVFYFPMLEIDREKILDPLLGTILGIIISIIILAMMITYRGIIAGLVPKRQPSSKLAEGYFVVVSLALFFFFFFLFSPAIFYLVSPSIPDNAKLATFFMTIMLFCMSNIVINTLDLGYRAFKGRKNKLLSQVS